MVEEQRHRIEQEMSKMINELDLEYLRKMQVHIKLSIFIRYFNVATVLGRYA